MVVINSYPRSHLICDWENARFVEKNFVHARPISRFLYDLPLWSYIRPIWDWSYDRWHDWRCDHRRLTRLLWDLSQDQSWWATTDRMPNVTSGSQSAIRAIGHPSIYSHSIQRHQRQSFQCEIHSMQGLSIDRRPVTFFCLLFFLCCISAANSTDWFQNKMTSE